MARWEDALDAQLDTWKFWRSDAGRDFARGYAQSGARAGLGSMDRTFLNEGMAVNLERASLLCDPVWVDPDMHALVAHAAESFQGEPLHESDLITPAGFMLLPRPVHVRDVHDALMSFRAIQWYPFELEAHTTADDELRARAIHARSADESVADAEGPGNWSWIKGVNRTRNGVRLRGVVMAFYHGYLPADRDDYDERDRELARKAKVPWPPTPYLMTHFVPWFYDQDGTSEWRAAFYDAAKWAQVAWKLMKQEVGVSERREPSGGFRKRAAKSPLGVKQVTVITLRRPRTQKEGAPTDVDWSHRWFVSGYWRLQPYPSLGLRRWIYVAGHVKGPADKPLIPRKLRAYEWTR